MRRMLSTTLLLLGVVLGCGGSKSSDKDKRPPDAAIPTLEMPALGVAAVADMNYVYGKGAKAYEQVPELYKKKDWAGVKAACEDTLAKDPKHLDAHRVLGTALAQLGELEAATPHFATALAGDFLRWGPKFPQDAELVDYLASPQGKALLKLHLELKAEVEAAISRGVWLLGRRSTFKWPSKSGSTSSRGELYAWDDATGRFIRLTHTEHQLAAWLPSPAGDELALIGYDKAELPGAKQKTSPPIVQAWVRSVDARTFEVRTTKATFKKVRGVAVYFGPGGQLLVDTLAAAGRWGTTTANTFSIDASTGKTSKSAAARDPGSARAVLTLDEVMVAGPARGLELTPSASDPALITEITMKASGRTITLPESGLGDGSVPRSNPSGNRVAFATWVDPCGDKAGPKPSLYVADAKTGDLAHLLTAGSRFNVRWLSDDRLIYEDDAGGLRIWDATAGGKGRETAKLADKAGFALSGLSPSAKPLCRQEPLADVVTDDGTEEPLPPEDVDPGAEPGPVTTP